MEQKIKEYLLEIEKERDVKILLACETGSRAWGFPSPDSDYDVRLIYKKHKDWYLGLGERKDTIDCFRNNNEIDISGWDLRKSLRLLWKSNAPLIERIQSPIIYQADYEFLKEITVAANQTYSRIATIHHYLSLAQNMFEDISSSEQYKLKTFFYALRSSVACLWIMEKEELPPIEFGKMLDELSLPPSIVSRTKELIALKATISESYLHSGDQDMIEFINENLTKARERGKTLPGAKGSMDVLDALFLKTLNSYDN